MTRKTIIHLNTHTQTALIATYDSKGKLIEERQCRAKIIEINNTNALVKPGTTSSTITLVVDNAFYKCIEAKIQVYQ